MSTIIEAKLAPPMQAIEFDAAVGSDGAIRMPPELADRIPAGKDVRVVVLWQSPVIATPSPPAPTPEYGEWTDEEWTQLGAYMMAKGYEEDPVDDNYDDLLKR